MSLKLPEINGYVKAWQEHAINHMFDGMEMSMSPMYLDHAYSRSMFSQRWWDVMKQKFSECRCGCLGYNHEAYQFHCDICPASRGCLKFVAHRADTRFGRNQPVPKPWTVEEIVEVQARLGQQVPPCYPWYEIVMDFFTEPCVFIPLALVGGISATLWLLKYVGSR